MTQSVNKLTRDVLFWSGGKDSFLALRYFQDITGRDPVLLTTYDDESGTVPHQDIPVETIRQQALDLGLILFTVPLSYPATNVEYLEALKLHLETIPFKINSLVFGDLHLEDIREWREKEFGAMGYELIFPIWKTPYDELFDLLEQEQILMHISAVMDDHKKLIKPGQIFNREFAESLPERIDKMGENGEFHTELSFR